MSRLKAGQFRRKDDRRKLKEGYVCGTEQIDAALVKRERSFELFVRAALLAFGAYQSILYFGYKIVPTSDFPAFAKVGHELLSFQIPSSFKRVPAFGLLLACLSYVVGGQYPDLTAGWLLNALLHPFNLLLFWLITKRVVGKSALWLAIIAILNPWVLRMLTDPIAETTLLFFILLTLYFIFKRSSWSYLFASITTMVRYEGAALIVAVFVMDVIYSKNMQQWVRAFIYSVIASVPLMVWLLGTVLTWKGGVDNYFAILFSKRYIDTFSKTSVNQTGILLHMGLLWNVGFRPLLMPDPYSSKDFAEFVWGLSKAVAVVSFFFGSIYGLCKRNWNILVLLIFFVPYFLLHATYPYPIPRYYTNVFWIALFICWFGLQSAWQIINKNQRIPTAVVTALQILILVVAGIWLFKLLPYLPKISVISPRSTSVPYAAIGLVSLLLGVQIFAELKIQNSKLLSKVVVLAVLALVIVSNQFMLVSLLGDGQADKEFVDLAQWYSKNAKPGEKLAVYMVEVVQMFAPKSAEYIVGFPKADSPATFAEACYKEGITYVVWASREGLNLIHTDYVMLNLDKNLALLQKPRSIGPYEFITQLGSNRGYVNVFRLHRPPSSQRVCQT